MHSNGDPATSAKSAASPATPARASAVGILAYGSLIDDPGQEIGPFVQETLRDIETPFCVEYARSSQSRGGSPTLVPVDDGGSRVAAVILVLRPSVTIELAQDWVWRRETGKYGNQDHYQPKPNPKGGHVIVETRTNFCGVDTVLSTRIGANISPLTADELAKRAVASVPKCKPGKDGITYLANAKKNGIITPLTEGYERAVLQLTGAADLLAALEVARRTSLPWDQATIVEAFCADCLWARTVRTHFRDLFESGEKRHELLAESAKGFFKI